MMKRGWCWTLPVGLLLTVLIVPGALRAQDFTVPDGYAFKSKEDFAKYEPQVLKCIEYLQTAPLGADAAKRRPANAFFMAWVQGAPNVNVEVQSYMMGLSSKNKDFILVFIAGWTRAELAHPGSADKTEYHLAGLRSVIKAYTQAAGVVQDDAVDAIVQQEKDGKLPEWLKDNLSGK
jgi:hypothetical protein